MLHIPDNRLYAITDSSLMPTDSIMLSKCRQALAAGCRLLQYRDKSDNSENRFRQAQQLKTLCQEYNAALIINDDLALAKELSVGLHLGQQDGSLSHARNELGPLAIIGATCHDQISLAKTAIEEGASYVAFGRFFSSSTKPAAKSAPVSLLAQAKSQLQHPIVAIGGITGDNSGQIFSAGADIAAACASVFDVDDIDQEIKKFNCAI